MDSVYSYHRDDLKKRNEVIKLLLHVLLLPLLSHFSPVWLCATPWTVAHQDPLWDFPGKNTGVGCHFLPPALADGFFTASATWETHYLGMPAESCHCWCWGLPLLLSPLVLTVNIADLPWWLRRVDPHPMGLTSQHMQSLIFTVTMAPVHPPSPALFHSQLRLVSCMYFP